MRASSIAASGMSQAADRFARASERLVRAVSAGDETDALDARMDQMEAETEFKANAESRRVADETMGALLDILV